MNHDLLIGIALAAAAAGCYDTAYALMALEARRAPARDALRPALLGYLARRPLWLGATALNAAGWPLQLVALSFAPLTVVQPTLALGLLLLLVLGVRLLGERVTKREVAATLAIVIGVAGLAWAAPERTTAHAGAAALAIVFAGLALVTLAPYALSRMGRRPGLASLALSAGAGDVWTALASRLIVDEIALRHWLNAFLWTLTAGVAFAFSLLSDMTALQRFEATRVGPVVLVAQVVIPVLLAPLLVGETWGNTPLGGAVLLLSLIVVAAGAAILGSSRAVTGMLCPQEGKDKTCS